MKNIFIVILFALSILGAGAQQPLTLGECVRAGLENNYSIKIARNLEQVAANNVTLAPLLPVVSAGASQAHAGYAERSVYRGADDVKSDYSSNIYNADVRLGWRLFDGMAMFATRETQRELLREGELNLRASMEQLVADIASQYYYIVTESGRMRAARRYLEISTIRYNQALEKYIIKSISGLEMKQARIDFNADSSKLVQREQVLRNAYVRLFELMNSPLTTSAQLCDTITPDPGLQSEALLASAMERNTAVCLALTGQRISDLDLRIARSKLYPTLDFDASYRYNHAARGNQPPLYTDYHGPTFGFTLAVPIFNGLDTRRRIRNADLDRQNSKLLYMQTCSGVESSLRQMYNTYRKNIAMIGFEQESADVGMANVEAAMEMYRLGSMSGVEFREIQRSYLEAEERKLDALFNAKVSEIGLLLLSGQIL